MSQDIRMSKSIMAANKINVVPLENMASGDMNVAGSQDTAAEAYDVYTSSKMYNAMKPLFISLRILGLHFTQSFGSVAECTEQVKCHNIGKPYIAKSHGEKKKKCSLSQAYSWIMCSLTYLMALKSITMYTYGDLQGADLFYKLTMTAWTILLAVNVSMFLMASYRYEGLPKFFIDVENIINQPVCLQGVRKTAWITMITTWIIWLIFAATQLYLIGAYPDVFYPLFAPLDLSHPNIDVMRGIVWVVTPLMLGVWIFPVAMDFLFSYTLYKTFHVWSTEFRQKLCFSMTNEVFVKERHRHQKLCQLVSDADEFLSVHNAGSLVCNVAMILFIVYNLMYAPEELKTVVFYSANLAWFSCVWVNLIITCYSGAMVNGAAHAIYEDLHSIDGEANVEEVHLFQSRLSGSSIGLTALGMFVIDKPAVLGMLSQLLTYFIVIIQFAPGSSTTEGDSCNCSAILANASLSCNVL